MKYKPKAFIVDVAAAGTAVQITTADIQTPWVMLQVCDGNTGSIFVGDSQVSSTNGIELKEADMGEPDLLAPHVIMTVPAPATISLSDIWVDTSSSGDDVAVMYLERID